MKGLRSTLDATDEKLRGAWILLCCCIVTVVGAASWNMRRLDAAETRVASMRSVIAASQSLLVEMRRSKGYAQASDEDAIAEHVRALIAQQQSELAADESSSLRGIRLATLLGLVGGLVTAAGIAWILWEQRRDVRRRRRTEHELREAAADLETRVRERTAELERASNDRARVERLRALGQLATGIAHDINNTISPVMLYIEALSAEAQSLSVTARRRLDIIRRGIGDVAETVARMRDFSRQIEPEAAPRAVNLNRLIEEVVELTRARWSDMPQQRGVVIELKTELDADLPLVLGVGSELRDALVNLIFNAVDAMPGGGPLVLRTRRLAAASAGGFVQLEVVDAGIGMSEETRRRCLEPFFSTKGEQGSGLGLAMVAGALQRHGSQLEIDSAVGRGTTVRCAFAVPSAPLAEGAVAEPDVGPSFDILVVDDDELVADAVCATLEDDGHRVTRAHGGQAGIDAYRSALAEGTPFPVVITDMGMPHVDGRHVASAVKAAGQRTRVILLTGWGQRSLSMGEISEHIDCVLNKPPTRGALRTALAKAM